MKLEIRWREITPTAALFEHIKEAITIRTRPHPWTLARLRVSLIGETDDWCRCRLEIGLRGGAVRVIEVASDDLMLAVDVASDRMSELLEDAEHRAGARHAA
jgi:hypothetical protein